MFEDRRASAAHFSTACSRQYWQLSAKAKC